MTFKSLGPLLAYSALTGLVTAFMFGALITVFGLCAAIPLFVVDNFSSVIKTIIHAFPSYVMWVVSAIVIGLVSGFFTGLVYALVRGEVGYWLGFLLLIVLGFVAGSMVVIPCIPLFIVGSLAAQYPEMYLLKKPLSHSHERLKPLSHYIGDWWLQTPSKLVRVVAFFLPTILMFGLEVSLANAAKYIQL